MILRLPEAWAHNGLPSADGGFVVEQDETTTWDEDIVMATWNGWQIWIDGGKGLSVWQCSLVEPHEPHKRPRYLLRDFVDALEEVQTWLDRAVRIAENAHTDRWPLPEILGSAQATHGTLAGESKT